ncbi:MAG: TIGR03790 family protein [Nitrospira sp.]|nr:TIGR03790 family protein [Nitrospira sp.]
MKFFLIFLSICSEVVVGVHPVWSVIAPEQVVVVANRNQPGSVELGNDYLAMRGVPHDHLIALDLPKTELITRKEYNQNLYDPLRAELQRRGLTADIRVLVTLWGVPLIVKGVVRTSEEGSWIRDAQDYSTSATGILEEQEHMLQVWLNSEKEPPSFKLPLSEEGPGTKSLIQQQKLSAWKKQVIETIQEIRVRVEAMDDAEQQKAGALMIEKAGRTIFGRFGWSALSGADSSAHSQSAREEETVSNLLVELLHEPTSVKRHRVYELVQEVYGFFGVVALANWEVKRYRQEESQASVDSELAMLWWEPDTYPLSGRIPNPLYMGASHDIHQWPFPLLMVSRLDAPTVAIARKMIDQALETERKGLFGNIYVDARGMKKESTSSYAGYDRDLQAFAGGMRGIRGMRVILENTEQRFSQPGQAPDVSLYVGWYRLRAYEDAFTFQPGAIGYHIASREAVSIHDANEQGWCKNALERGITVTLGAVSEPYLDAFPLATEFFGLLYSGRYSLVETYALSSRYLSWQMVLLGDPLYQPWKGHDPVREKVALSLLNRNGLPPAPAVGVKPGPSRKKFQKTFSGKYLMLDPRMLQP